MLHKHRTFCVAAVPDLATLVDKLTAHTWTTCTGFAWQNLLLLNDSFSANGAQEYAVIRDTHEIESLTVSWMTPEQLTATLTTLRTDPDPRIYGCLTNPLETPAQHRHCLACA